MTTVQSKVSARSYRIAFPDQSEGLLLEIFIDCPGCGQEVLRIAGHHLRALRQIVIETIDANPDLTGSEQDLQVLNRLKFNGVPPGDPSQN